jgi:HD-GYP domain-containing protein (c-di-GMP phosphodiesterase class II)
MNPSLRQLIPIVRHHHERYDGKGYPDGLSGYLIPIEARIVSVADAIESMASDRPYRRARNNQYIREELKRFAGTQFDPKVVEQALRFVESEGINKSPSENSVTAFAIPNIGRNPTQA